MLANSLKFFQEVLKNKVICLYFACGELCVEVSSENLEVIVKFFKDHEVCLFKLLVDITVVDFPENQNRFAVFYHLISVKYNLRIKILTRVNETRFLSSITNLFKNASWLEREVFDMFGIYFEKHPDLRRILTDYGFEGYPLRKDFPLSGYTEARYDESQKRVVFESLELSQEFRVFTFSSPWEKK